MSAIEAGGTVTITVPKMIDAEQVASILDISERHLARLVHIGEFPKPMKFGRTARWPASDVTGYLEKRRIQRDSKPRRGRDA